MNDQTAVLITGVTGFLGGRLLRRLLDDNQRVIVLCRGRRGKDERAASARTRVDEMLHAMDCNARRAQVYVIETDLANIAVKSLSTALRIGMQALNAQRLLLVNVAASLKMDFSGQDSARRRGIASLKHSTNAEGLSNILAALDGLAANVQMTPQSIAGVVHFSTCYAHGRCGVLPEASLSKAFETQNSCEQSKREGEAVLERWQAERAVRVPLTVIRPSIVTGTGDGYAGWDDVRGESANQERLSGWMRRLVGALPSQLRLINLMIHSLRRARTPFVPMLDNTQEVFDFIDGDDVERYSMEVLRHHLREPLPTAIRYLRLANPEARFATEETVAYFAERGVVYSPRRIDRDYVRGLIRPLAATPVRNLREAPRRKTTHAPLIESAIVTSDS